MKSFLRSLIVVLGLIVAILGNYLSSNMPPLFKEHPELLFLLFVLVAVGLIAAEVFIELEGRSWRGKRVQFLTSLPRLKTPLRGREKELDELRQFIEGPDQILVIDGEPGVGKTTLVASFVSESSKSFGFIAWQSLFGSPSTREMVNGWLHLLHESPPEVSIAARVDSLLLAISKFRPKRALLVFDNAESVYRTEGRDGRSYPPEEFCWLLSRLASFSETRFKMILTSTISMTPDMFPGEAPKIATVTLKGLNLQILRQVISDRISAEVGSHNDKMLALASGNPSAAILLADLEIRNSVAVQDHPETGRTLERVVSSHLAALDNEQHAVLGFLCAVRTPMSAQEIQTALGSVRQLRLGIRRAITELAARHLVDEGEDGKIVAGPVVAEVMVETAVGELLAVVMRGNLESVKLLRAIPLDHVGWSDSMRATAQRLVFAVVEKRLREEIGIEPSNFRRDDIEALFRIIAQNSGFDDLLASNLLSFLLYTGSDITEVTFPSMALVGVDFSRVHLFDVDMDKVNLHDCRFADKIGAVYAVRIIGDDRVLIGLASGAVELRSLKSLSSLARREAHSEPVRAVMHVDSADWVLTGGEDGRVNMLDASSLDILASWKLHESWVWRIIVTGEGDIAVSVASDGTLGIIDLLARAPIGRVVVPSKRLWDACIVGSNIYVTAEDGILWTGKVSDLKHAARTGRLVSWSAAANVGDPIKACCQVDNNVIFGCRNGRLYCLEHQTGTVQLMSVEEACVRDLSQGSRPHTAISVGDAGIARKYSIDRRELISEKQFHSARAWSIDVNSEGLVASGGDDRSVRLWSEATATAVRSVHGYGQTLRSMDWLGQDLILGCADDFLRKGTFTRKGIDLSPWKTLKPGRRILGVAALHDGRWTCGFDDGSVCIGGKDAALYWVKAHSYAIESMARSPDGSKFATGGEDRRIIIFDSNGHVVTEPQSLHSSRIWALDFAPSGSKLVSAGGDFIIAAWDSQTGGVLWSGTGHTNLVLAARWVDESRVVSAGTDGTMRLWVQGVCRAIVQVGCIIRGLVTDGRGEVYGVGRRSESSPGWMVVRWNVDTNTLYQKELGASGGSARSVIFSQGALLVGGDFPYLLVVDASTLDVRYQMRIPGPYAGLKLNAEQVTGTDLESIELLGGNISGKPRSAQG